MNNESDMQREFNDTGLCVPHLHYMADRPEKVEALVKLVAKGKYFTINRPRQYGKTTLLYLLEKKLESMDYLVLRVSFEGIGDSVFSGEELFAPAFLKLLHQKLKQADRELAGFVLEQAAKTKTLLELSEVITHIVETNNKKTVLLIDEVDKSSNNQLFLSFLGVLRAKYLQRNEGTDTTFYSVVLAGVHDVKTLKLKLRADEETKFNSPWNIAVDFKVDMSLDTGEIESLLADFLSENKIRINIGEVTGKLYYLTSGHPFLVSRLCKIVHEDVQPGEEWNLNDIDAAVILLMQEDNTNFQSLFKNLENNSELYEFVFKIIMNGQEFFYNPHNRLIQLGVMFGILRNEKGKIKIHNRLYEQLIYNYMASNLETSGAARF